MPLPSENICVAFGHNADSCSDWCYHVVLLLQIETDVRMCLCDLDIHTAFEAFVWCVHFCLYVSVFFKRVWSAVLFKDLSAMIRVTCCCVYSSLSVRVTHPKI